MNKYHFKDKCDEINKIMISELKQDIDSNAVYLSKDMYPEKLREYNLKFLEHVTTFDLEGFVDYLQKNNFFRETKNDGSKVASNAAQRLAEGEFNKIYIRAVCKKAINSNLSVVIYRYKESSVKRIESEEKIGEKVDPGEVYDDLIKNRVTGVASILPEVSSGLSV